MPVRPNREKRPVSPAANAHHVMQVALGIKEEECVEPHVPKMERKIDEEPSKGD